ncbi:TonB-dependent receptor [Sphingomonas sp.]|uniref:TonB-dependent receptor domain-containing protein n=1 Tax=Sphingomonas sp. TaxID=28214 RepID=UPI001D234DF8|nr:TonB-dependent receptor [Sphingomonas sp.]MBX9797222.1 TonB-dependent receptor [Sphingomonas sp.]
MTFKTKIKGLLLVGTVLPAPVFAQQTAPQQPPQAAAPAPAEQADQAAEPQEEKPEVSAPGGVSDEVVVVGRRIPNVVRTSRQVASLLTEADIARTGEGDIAGALQRVTGLSVVGGRFVYVRGLGERYSLALLNGLPIPSPDPLRRVVPLDLFPTKLLASSLVQKSYSANFPGEFGGGVINLTTRAVPKKAFLEIGGNIGANTATTGQLGYVFQGSRNSVFGYLDSQLALPPGLAASQANGRLLAVGGNFNLRQLQDITISLNNAETNVIQANTSMPANWGLNFSAGSSWDVGTVRLGFIAAAGWSTDWQTKAGLQQLSNGEAVGPNGIPILRPDTDFNFVSSENRVIVNGLLGFGAEIGEHRIRFTNVYINDTIKEARIQAGRDDTNVGRDVLLNRSFTGTFQRQLITSQLVGEFKFDKLTIDVRTSYANTKRLAPYERNNNYAFSARARDFVNDLRSPGQASTVAFSRLNENVWAAGADFGYKVEGGPFPIRLTAGYAFTNNQRNSSRFDYRFNVNGVLPFEVTQQRPDFLLSDFNVQTFGIFLNTISTTAPFFTAGLVVHAGYAQFEIEPLDGVQLTAGVRYESGNQFVNPVDVFNVNPAATRRTEINRNYVLPGGTLTWNFAEDMQARFSVSKTVARPQFRELAPQTYIDTDTDRTSFGNQFLQDSQLFNAEARYEWYFGRDERLTIGGFYKDITNPIESVAFNVGGTFNTTYANAPKGQLFGFEAEVQKYIPVDQIVSWRALATRRIFINANYTFTNSSISFGNNDTTVFPFSGEVRPARDLFRLGQPLTGQSDHIVNLQLSLQDRNSLSEQTLLVNYASERATQRGPNGQPDLVERPGLRFDFVVRQGFKLGGVPLEAKFEARNITNVRYQEFQTLNGSRIDNNTFVLGRTFQLGLSAQF